ncbi:MAG: putative addiction module antidote protein [Methylacidiphilales bacterium]|nr:putative addiction module antidote protein [Candidatus Methylacidiphilales bacterium]
MNTIFMGGSRHVSRLPAEVKARIDNVVASGHQVIVGDANGADKAVQKHLFDRRYPNVTIFCSGDAPRNNVGAWRTRPVAVPKSVRGFQFHAAKDREMAQEADFGLMIWDGRSPGTVLNVLRLALAGKIAVLFDVPGRDVVNIKTADQLRLFLARCSQELLADLKARATADEWRLVENDCQPSLFTPADSALPAIAADSDESAPLPPALDEPLVLLNDALARGDAAAAMTILGGIARDCGMSRIARDTGLARESLYRSLDARGNPEFATVLKVLSSIGLRFEAKSGGAASGPEPARATG